MATRPITRATRPITHPNVTEVHKIKWKIVNYQPFEFRVGPHSKNRKKDFLSDTL